MKKRFFIFGAITIFAIGLFLTCKSPTVNPEEVLDEIEQTDAGTGGGSGTKGGGSGGGGRPGGGGGGGGSGGGSSGIISGTGNGGSGTDNGSGGGSSGTGGGSGSGNGSGGGNGSGTANGSSGGSETGSETDETSNDNTSHPEITGLSFHFASSKLRVSDAIEGTIIGTIGEVTGGTPPYTYFLTNLSDLNDTDNRFFMIDGLHIKISVPDLTQSIYYLNFGVKDSNGKTLLKREEFIIYHDPISKEQEFREANGVSFAMRYICPGSFTTIPLINDSYDVPATVMIPTGYWMSETEVTQELFQCVMGYNPSNYSGYPAEGEIQKKRPVENLTFKETIVFCNRLSIMLGKEYVYKNSMIDDWLSFPNDLIINLEIDSFIESFTADGFRIPSEFEWQWAAIGADVGGYNSNGYLKIFSGGQVDSLIGRDEYIWYSGNSSSITHEVGKKQSNEVGIYDMTGNVWEYVSTGYLMGWSAFDYPNPSGSGWVYYQGNLDTVPQNEHAPCGIRLVSNK